MSTPTSTATIDASKSSSARIDVLAIVALIAPWLAAWLLPAFAQPQSFHDYADQRAWLGLAHAADVLSNVVFLLVGVLGLNLIASRRATLDRSSIWPYSLLFVGVLLTAFGSAWYHWNPNDPTLMWDRLPMALGFAGLVAGTFTDRAPQRAIALTLAFAVVGAASVLYWHVTGNLTPYLVMQGVFIAVALVATATIASRFTLPNRVYSAAGAYALALIFERLDHPIYGLTGGLISGHTLKHVTASAAILIVYWMLRDRREVPTSIQSDGECCAPRAQLC